MHRLRAAYWGLRRQELVALEWADLDLATRRLHVRGEVKSEDADRILVVDQGTAGVLAAWQERQLFERLEWDSGWQDSGRVFTREDGSRCAPAPSTTTSTCWCAGRPAAHQVP